MPRAKSYSMYCVAAFIALSIPLLLTLADKDNKPNLVGQVISDVKPEFSWKDWFSRAYQDERDEYNNDHWVFKESAVRFNNQFYYDAFNQIRVNNFVSGKENYIFAEGYIHAALGDDLLPEEKITSMLDKAKVIQDTLKKKGITLVLAFAPGKGKYCIEFVEDKYLHPVNTTNHQLFVKHGMQRGLNVLDLYSYFEKLKPHAQYPLFTRFGHHWSYYGECIATESIVRYIEKVHGADLPDFTWQEVEASDTARGRDADVLKSMNLMWEPPQNMKLGYPRPDIENDSSKNVTRVLTIGDSYWYGPVYMGVPYYCFAGGEFWYYFNKVVPTRQAGTKTEVWELDLKTELERNQVIMLLYSDGNLTGFGNSFFDDVYEMYTSPESFRLRYEKHKKIQSFAKQIRENPLLLKKSTQRSRDEQLPLDSAIYYDARKMAGI